MKRLTRIGILLFIGVTLQACAGRKVVQESKLPYEKQRVFDEHYFNASKYKVLGDYQRAAEEFAEALKIDPNSHAAMYQLGNLNIAVSNFADAVYWSERALLTSPKFNYWYAGQLAQAYNKVGSYQKSAEIFEVMIQEQPENGRNYIEAANQYINAKAFKKAIAVLESFVKVKGINEEAARKLEGLYFEIGKPAKGIAWMEYLVEVQPNEIRFKGLLAESYVRNKQYDKVKSIYLAMLRVDKKNGYAHFGMSDLYRKARNQDSSYYHLTQAFEDNKVPLATKSKVIGSYLPFIMTNDVMRNQALELASILVRVHPKSDRAYLVYGDMLHASERYSEARAQLVKATELNSGDLRIWRKLLSLDDELNDWPNLYTDSKNALEYFPNQPYLYIINSYASFMLQKFEEAVAVAEEGLDIALLKDDQANLLTTIGDASFELKDYTKCFDSYEQVLELVPDDYGAMNNYAYYLSTQKVNLDKALEMINTALEFKQRPTFHDTRGWVLFQMGKYAEALVDLKIAFEQIPNDKEIRGHYIDCLIKLGKHDEAKIIQDQAVN